MKCARFAPIAALVAVGLVTIGSADRAATEENPNEAKPPFVVKDSQAGSAAISAALAKSVNFEFVETPLNDVIQFVKETYKIEILADNRVLSDAGIDPTSLPITLKVDGISLKSALAHLFGQQGLIAVIQDEVLLVTTKERAESILEPRVYGVLDLITSKNDAEFDYDPLIDMITGTVATQTWSELGGPSTIEGMHGNLVISQTEAVHQLITELLATLRAVHKEQEAGKTEGAKIIGAGNRIPPKIEKLLSLKTSLEYVETPLTDVLADLSNRVGISFQIDARSLSDAGIDPSLPMTIDVRNVSVRAALANLLRPHELVWLFQNEVPLITTKEQGDLQQIIGVYPVADIVGPNSQTDAEKKLEHAADDADVLIDTLTGNVDTETWSELGGPGTISSLDKEYPMLVISQTAQTHEKIERLLGDLRESRRAQAEALGKLAAEPMKPQTPELRVYALRIPDPKAPMMTPNEIVETLKLMVEPQSWTDKQFFIHAVTGRLIVRHTPKVQREIRKLLLELGVDALSGAGAAAAGGGGFGGGGGAGVGGGGGFGGGGGGF
jgi:hypothetical protein